MVSAFDSGSSGLCSNPGPGHCVVFLDKTLNFSYSASLHQGGVLIGTREFNAMDYQRYFTGILCLPSRTMK